MPCARACCYSPSMADRKDARVGCEDSSPLLELPPELLQHVFSAVSAKGHQQLAGTCKAVRTQVLSQTEKLTLPLDRASVIEGSKNKATAALLAAVQRDHADLSLKLSLAKVAPKRILDELAVIGPCPSVTELELANVSEPGQWTEVMSWMAAGTFPHLRSLKLTGCAIPLDSLDPLLDVVDSLTLHSSQLCDSGAAYDPNWPLQLLGGYPISKIQLKGTFTTVQHPLEVDSWLDRFSPSGITHLTVHQDSLGEGQDWLEVMMGIPNLEYFELCPEATALTGGAIKTKLEVSLDEVSLLGLSKRLPHLHTLRLPFAVVSGKEALQELVTHPSLRVVQVKEILSTDGPEIKPASSASTRLERLEVEAISSSALAILPGYAIDALAPTTLYNVHDKITISVRPPYDVWDFDNEDPTAQPDWSLVNAMVSKLGRRLVEMAPMLKLHLNFNELPDSEEPELQDLMTGRLLQLIQRLEPLGNWKGAGIQSIEVTRSPLGFLELQALGAALGRHCTRLTASGLPFKDGLDDGQANAALQRQASKEVGRYFPRLARSKPCPPTTDWCDRKDLQWTAAAPDPDAAV